MTLFARRAVFRFARPGEPFREIEGLRVRFASRYDPRGSVRGEFGVWNLARDQVETLQAEDAQVQVLCGYGDDLGPVVLGTTVRGSALSQRNGPDRVTTGTVRDSLDVLRSVSVAVTLSDTSASQAVTILAREAGLAVGAVSLGVDFPITRPRLFAGPIGEVLQVIADSSESRFAIEDGTVSYWPTDGSRRVIRRTYGEGSGMIGEPEIVDDERVRITTLLDPARRPGDQYDVDSTTTGLSGQYVAETVEHRGDLWGREWYSLIVGRRTET